MKKNTLRLLQAFSILLVLVPATAFGARPATSPAKLIRAASDVVKRLARPEDGGFPPYFLYIIRGMAIIPAAPGQSEPGGQPPKGVMLSHDMTSGWSYPVLISFTAQNLPDDLRPPIGGPPAASDIIVLFVAATTHLSKQTYSIGSRPHDAAALFERARTAFEQRLPLYRPTHAAFLHAHNDGYAAIALDAVIEIDQAATAAYYAPINRIEIPPLSILTGNERVVPPEAAQAMEAMLDALTPVP